MAAGGHKFGGGAAAAGGGGGGDLYAVLGLKKECTDAELKVAYRKLAMRWHPDRCSASGSSKRVEEAKEKFQEIQGAYSVLSDSNKRFLYDVGVYDSDGDDEELQGMGDFLGEMAQMMSQAQAQPTGNGMESFEELQRLFVDMFHADLDAGFCSGPWAHKQSPSPPPPAVPEAEAPSVSGVNKRGCSAMDSRKPPRPGEAGPGQNGFCFGKSDSRQPPRSGCSKRRNGRKQKLSPKHDVSSANAEASAV